jgi:IPT/TIG domain
MKSNLGWYIFAAFLLLAVTVGAVVFATLFRASIEIVLGLTVIAGVCALLLVLFIIAAGFTAMKMNDPQQALGLPEGSIRAMIALMLIIIWIIMSVFLLNVTNGAAANSDTARMAQQLVTTIGTLVVAVAAFYFGSRSVESATHALAAGNGQKPQPVIEHVDPKQGQVGTDCTLTITGRNFRRPTVKLVQTTPPGQEAREIGTKGSPLSNDTTISCTMTLGTATDQKLVGQWALLVVNEDGEEHQLESAFEITQPQPPAPA